MEPIAVLAGTPVDTQMGVDVLSAAGLSGAPFPISPDPREQTAFQISSPAEKHRTALAILNRAQAQGCRKAFVYCNSLSASVDFDALARETGMRIVTPLQVYRTLAPQYRSLAFIAANAQGLAGIERVLLDANPGLDTLSTAALPVVLAIEAGLPPEELVQRHTVRSTDIDMGRHMNNVAYVRLLLDCFPASVLAGGEIASMEIHYAAPCFEGEELSVLCRREGSICRMAVRKPDGKTAILAAVRFHEK